MVQLIFMHLLDTIKTFDSDLETWLREKRLSKPNGMLNYIVKHLKELDDEVILQKLKKLEKSTEKIATIIYSKKNDLEKKNMIIELMNSDLEELTVTNKCQICNLETCDSIEFCEAKTNNWLGI
jgi:uncharacterized protein YaaN involved in tellurite resistance